MPRTWKSSGTKISHHGVNLPIESTFFPRRQGALSILRYRLVVTVGLHHPAHCHPDRWLNVPTAPPQGPVHSHRSVYAILISSCFFSKSIGVSLNLMQLTFSST